MIFTTTSKNILDYLKQIIIFFLFFFLLVSCKAQKECNNCGVIRYGLKNYIPQLHDYIADEGFWTICRIWYKDSLAIEEIKKITIKTDNKDKETRTVSIMHFTFVDIKTRSLYEYSSFSDTARLIKKYYKPDTVSETGFWTFYAPAPEKDIPGYETPETISDTVVDKVLYKRMKLAYTAPDTSSIFKGRIQYIAYFRCDLNHFMFNYGKGIPQRINCPCVRLDQLPTLESAACVSQFAELIAKELTVEELKVFNAWEKYAKKNPVN